MSEKLADALWEALDWLAVIAHDLDNGNQIDPDIANTLWREVNESAPLVGGVNSFSVEVRPFVPPDDAQNAVRVAREATDGA